MLITSLSRAACRLIRSLVVLCPEDIDIRNKWRLSSLIVCVRSQCLKLHYEMAEATIDYDKSLRRFAIECWILQIWYRCAIGSCRSPETMLSLSFVCAPPPLFFVWKKKQDSMLSISPLSCFRRCCHLEVTQPSPYHCRGNQFSGDIVRCVHY